MVRFENQITKQHCVLSLVSKTTKCNKRVIQLSFLSQLKNGVPERIYRKDDSKREILRNEDQAKNIGEFLPENARKVRSLQSCKIKRRHDVIRGKAIVCVLASLILIFLSKAFVESLFLFFEGNSSRIKERFLYS